MAAGCLIRAVLLVLTVFSSSGAGAGEVLCEGVLGNSGEQGKHLVRFADQEARGMGVAYDRFGSLWDRAGAGTLNRYSPDGRLLGQYRIPAGGDGQDKLTIVADVLVMQIKGKLYTLDVASAPGAEARPLGRDSECMSFGSFNGCVASCLKGKVYLVNPKTGEAKELTGVGEIQGQVPSLNLELTPQGRVVWQVQTDRLRLFVDGKEVPGGLTEKPSVGRLQLLDGFWYGHAWHATIKRFDANFQTAPGTVLGGASGWVIGHLDENAELFNGNGMARVGENLYAVSGIGGIMHLLQWQGDKQAMRIVRRIGSVRCTGIGLDAEGTVWSGMGTWKWSDGPDAPLANGISGQIDMGQAVCLDGDAMVQPATRWGKSVLISGKLTSEPKFLETQNVTFLKGHVGAAAYAHKGRLVLLVIDKAGKAQSLYIGPDGAFHGLGPGVALKTASPVKEWTSLAMKGPDTLLAAADGYVIELTKEADDWKETRRWNSWGKAPSERFGQTIYLAADGDRLWVSDRLRHRVLCFDLKTGGVLGSFGNLDRAGDDLASLSSPEVIAARGGRAVVFDSANQRLVKLRAPVR
jgi:hypothetical protein